MKSCVNSAAAGIAYSLLTEIVTRAVNIKTIIDKIFIVTIALSLFLAYNS